MELLFKFFAIFIFIIIFIISIIIFFKSTTTSVEEIIKDKLSEPTIEINNKIIKLTKKEISQNTLDLFNYKHSKFVKNLDNSIQFCIDNNKFMLADNVSKYKILYMDLYKIKINLEKNSVGKYIDYNSNEEFLLKSIQMDNLNTTIQKMN
tara:strand:- start:1881 stop:2330 length:450 start_codon:yes stop_codon:yes gene_type:complete